jgi:hypothetical protein
VRRFFWRMAYPFVIVANKFGASYKWVNVVKSAWMTAETGFGPLWHYRWFGDEIAAIPDRVVLCGIGYRVSVAEGLVLFKCDDGMSVTRIEFTRDPHDKYGFLWYVNVGGACPGCHLEQAYEWVKAVYGGSHQIKKLPLASSR